MKQQALLPGLQPAGKRDPEKENGPVLENAGPEAGGQDKKDAWPPMAEMLHSLLVCEPAAQQSGRAGPPEEPESSPVPPVSEPVGARQELDPPEEPESSPNPPLSELVGARQELEPPEEPELSPSPPLSELVGARQEMEPAEEPELSPILPEPVVVLGLESGCGELSDQQRQLLDTADLICAGRALLERLSLLEKNVGDSGRVLPLAVPLEPVLTRMVETRAEGKRVLALTDGDPLFYGLGASLIRHLGSGAVHVIPALSCLQLACARLGLPWHDVVCLSLHGRNDFGQLNAAVGKGVPLCVLTDGVIRPDVLARHLLDRGVDWFFAHVFERLNFPDETAFHVSLDKAATMEFGPSCTVVFTPSAPPRRPWLGLETGELAAESGIVTKLPVRSAALALLRIAPTHTVWDIGAGSGAVAIEAAVLAHEGCVAAVEKKPERVLCIEENRRRFGAAVVDVFPGEAPACFAALPDPHRVFIGGGISGPDGPELLQQVCFRLPPGGRLVVSCVLLNTLIRCREFFSAQGWPSDIVCVQAAQTQPLADDAHFVALNPVFVLAAQKPEGIT